MSWERYPELFAAERAWKTHLSGWFTARAAYALCPRWKRKTDQNSMWNNDCSVLHREGGWLTRSETRSSSVAARPLEGKRRNKRCKETRSHDYNATMADRWKVSSRPNSQFIAGEMNNVSTRTILQQLTSHTLLHGVSDQDMRTVLCCKSTMDHYQGRSKIERIFHQQLAYLQLSNVRNDGWIFSSRKTNESDRDHSMKNYDQILNGKAGIGTSTNHRRHLHLQQLGGSQENDTNHYKENGKINKKWEEWWMQSLFNPSVLFARILHIRFFVRSRVQTLANVVHATGVKRGHFVVGTERDTDAHFFSCPAHVTDQQTHMRLAQGYVDCLSPHAHPKSLIRLLFRCTSLESHFSSPTPFSSFRSTLLPTQTPYLDKPSISAEFFDESKTLCHSARRSPVRPLGRAEPSHRLGAQISYRSQQWAHADQLARRHSFDTDFQRSCAHGGCIGDDWHDRSGTVDFATVFLRSAE